MSIDLLQMGLDAQAASIGKGPLAKPAEKAVPIPSYRPPIEQVCPSCGTKFVGFSCRREACQ